MSRRDEGLTAIRGCEPELFEAVIVGALEGLVTTPGDPVLGRMPLGYVFRTLLVIISTAELRSNHDNIVKTVQLAASMFTNDQALVDLAFERIERERQRHQSVHTVGTN